MREIKCRGKGIADNEWYYGDLIIANDTDRSRHYYIITNEYSDKDGNIPNGIKLDTCNSPEVVPETLEQYTGLKDKNGKEIYEGDIVKARYFGKKVIGEIEFVMGTFAITNSAVSDNQMFIFEDKEVIGNIHDNPELMEV